MADQPQQAEVDQSVQVSPVSRGRMRPRGSRREVFVWYTMRVSGLMLFVLALAHFSILHFIYDPGAQTADFIASQRWNQFFWRAFDWLLLMNVLLHGFLGVRTVVVDYIHRPAWRDFTLLLLYTTAVLLLIIGTQVILTLPSATAAQ
ncbi:MAG: succinate dehydrogenase [Chloroflexota bacterium]|nr:succinate dehydrogenase [Chloroflexota bacterium]